MEEKETLGKISQANYQFLIESIFSLADGYSNVNLTKDMVIGAMYSIINGKPYSLNEQIGMPENAKYSELVLRWVETVKDEEKTAFLEYFNRENMLRRYQNGERHIIFTYWTRNAAHDSILAENHMALYQDEETGDVLGVNYILDRTEHYLAEKYKKELEEKNRKLEEATKKAEQANEMKSCFLSSISHDIRTPVNGIQGMLRIADAYPADMKKQNECREKVWIASNYLVSLVNNVLDMKRLESKAIELSENPFNLIDLLMNITAMTDIQIEEQGLHSVVDWKPGYINHRHLIGSAEGFSRILMNLNSNAIKYNKKGGTIYCRCMEKECDGDIAWFEIINADTGIGMDEEFLKRAFEPYSQKNNMSLNSINGVGLGLSIVKQTVEQMGGSLKVESKVDEGTRYTIMLPFRIDHNPQIQKPPALENISLEGVKALLVEDNNLNMEIAKFWLEEEKVQVFTAVNGQEAVEMFEKSEIGFFDIVLMDIMMPIMDGLEATRRIRSSNRADGLAIPIVAMSANAFEQDIEKSLRAGMNEHLTKPLDGKKVTETMKKYLANKITK